MHCVNTLFVAVAGALEVCAFLQMDSDKLTCNRIRRFPVEEKSIHVTCYYVTCHATTPLSLDKSSATQPKCSICWSQQFHARYSIFM